MTALVAALAAGLSVVWGAGPDLTRRFEDRPRRSLPRVAVRSAALAVATIAAVTIHPIAPAVGLVAGWCRRSWRRIRAGAQSQAAIDRTMPEVADLFVVAAEAGLSIAESLSSLASVPAGPMTEALSRARRGLDHGQRTSEVIDGLDATWGPRARPLTRALRDHHSYRTPLVPALERAAAEVRAVAQRDAEVRARRLPVTLLFPLVLCTLPAFGLLTLGPLMASTLTSLDPSRAGLLVDPTNSAPLTTEAPTCSESSRPLTCSPTPRSAEPSPAGSIVASPPPSTPSS